ncbi:MAG: hypothetical protein H0U23_13905 [Blastocatellia bacterium]|nr:hypothetical protein [Blastocatellia bacterium]
MTTIAPTKRPQYRKAEAVYTENPRETYWGWNAGEAAEDLARTCHGLQNWEGVKSGYASSGLARLANAWLRKNHPDSNARVDEYPLSDGTSRYSPYWETPKGKR